MSELTMEQFEQDTNKMTKLYGYRLDQKRKFTVDIEDICECINCDNGFSEDYFVFTTEEDRDFHFNENIEIEIRNEEKMKKGGV